jgi:pyruvate dehydrogenase E1 component
MNENYVHPAMPDGAELGIRKGMYMLRASTLDSVAAQDGSRGGGPPVQRVRLLGSGTILRECLAAAQLLENEHGIAAEVWSVTSYTELRRDGLECDALPLDSAKVDVRCASHALRLPWVAQCLGAAAGPVIAASDYVRAVPDFIRTWVPGKYVTLGTDGFGRSDTRSSLRRHFGVDGASIVRAALKAIGG